MHNRLRILRAERNLAQYQLARLAGVEATRYWRIEHDLVLPTAQEKSRIAAALGVVPRRVWPSRCASPISSAETMEQVAV